MNFDQNHFGWSDLARRRDFEHRHKGAPIEVDLWPKHDTRPSCEAVQSAPLRHFALCGFVLGILVAMYLNGGF